MIGVFDDSLLEGAGFEPSVLRLGKLWQAAAGARYRILPLRCQG
jgi:hypothetical protein